MIPRDHPIMELFDEVFKCSSGASSPTISVSAIQNKENVEKLLSKRKGEMGQFAILIALERLVGLFFFFLVIIF
jgi:hypothetical protein